MPGQVFIRTEDITCGGEDQKAISVDLPLVRVKKNDLVKFHNMLEGNVAADIKFFSTADKGGTPLPGFCNGEPGDTFQVPGGPGGPNHRDCGPAFPEGDYAYTITATNHLTLDPIIIIEPTAMMSKSLYGPIIGAAVGALLMYLICRTLFGKNRQAA